MDAYAAASLIQYISLFLPKELGKMFTLSAAMDFVAMIINTAILLEEAGSSPKATHGNKWCSSSCNFSISD